MSGSCRDYELYRIMSQSVRANYFHPNQYPVSVIRQCIVMLMLVAAQNRDAGSRYMRHFTNVYCGLFNTFFREIRSVSHRIPDFYSFEASDSADFLLICTFGGQPFWRRSCRWWILEIYLTAQSPFSVIILLFNHFFDSCSRHLATFYREREGGFIFFCVRILKTRC